MTQPSRIDLAAFVVTFGGTVLVASDQGGFFSRSWPWAGIYFAAVGGLVLPSVATTTRPIPQSTPSAFVYPSGVRVQAIESHCG
jgi:hypothetical protein